MVAHPEVLVQVSQKLQQQQQESQQMALTLRVMNNQLALLRDADTPVVGPDTANVAVIEFFDYQCIYCSKLAPELEKVMKATLHL
ncbi:thioredoxin domain-containing protein (plasmid) [Phytobacter diazotrophicus]|nr:thioredoxin domain-containing protein [Phytobacter diazotrophicus]